MNTLVIVLIAAVVLVCAYAFYGRWVAKTWGINPNAQTPAVKYNDGKDYVPTNGWTVFSHQFLPLPVQALLPVQSSCSLRLAAGSAVGAHRRRFLWRYYRLRRFVCFR